MREQPASISPRDLFGISDEEFDQLIRDVERQYAAKKRRRANPYVLHLIKLLWPHGRSGLRKNLVVERIREMRQALGLNMPRAFDKTVQSAFNQHNGQSTTFKLSQKDDLFYPVNYKRSGIWAVHINKIGPWLKRKKLAPP